MRPAGAEYQADGWSVIRSFAEVAGEAMHVTAARDEPWRHLAHDGRQERVPLTSSAPPSHSLPIAAQPLVHEVRG